MKYVTLYLYRMDQCTIICTYMYQRILKIFHLCVRGRHYIHVVEGNQTKPEETSEIIESGVKQLPKSIEISHLCSWGSWEDNSCDHFIFNQNINRTVGKFCWFLVLVWLKDCWVWHWIPCIHLFIPNIMSVVESQLLTQTLSFTLSRNVFYQNPFVLTFCGLFFRR